MALGTQIFKERGKSRNADADCEAEISVWTSDYFFPFKSVCFLCLLEKPRNHDNPVP